MERASARAAAPPSHEPAVLAAAVRSAVRAAAEEDEPAAAIDAAVSALHREVDGIYPSVFVREHSRLWLVAQRGYAVVPDGIGVEQGIIGRAVRLGRAQLVGDVRADPDYVEGSPAATSEVAVPLRAGRRVVGIFNIESERRLPESAVRDLRPLTAALAPRVEALREKGVLDLSALARLFVYLGSLRDPRAIAELAAASLARVVRLETSQVWMWDLVDLPNELASWHADGAARPGLSLADVQAARALADPTYVCQVLELPPRGRRGRKARALVWVPLRASGEEIGALVGEAGEVDHVELTQLDTAAVLAAHVAASLDAAISLHRERLSAVTDALTGILNRRGLEERLERALAAAEERRLPLSVLVLDCDDFKEINDRAGHEFGDTLLCEVADVLTSSLPEEAEVGRLGGDEFVVTLLGAGTDVAEALGARIRSLLAEGLTDAGFPLGLSGGIATYPFDGATPTALLRAADQALYFAKEAGKGRNASFRDIVAHAEPASRAGAIAAADERRGGRRDGAILADALAAARAIEAEESAGDVLARLCKALVFVVGATACSASRVVGGYLVDAAEHALRDVSLGREAAYRISDFPLTAETLRLGRARAMSFLEGDVDAAEAFVLRELGMNAMLMVPLRVRGRSWGLIELYEMRLRRFTEDDVSVAQFLGTQAERRLDVIAPDETLRQRPPVYELPAEAVEPRTRRSR